MKDDYQKFLSIKLGVPINKINKDNLKYYYTKWPELCCKYNLESLDPTIGPFEFNKAIGVLNEYYKDIQSNYYKNLYNESKKYKDGEPILDKLAETTDNETLD